MEASRVLVVEDEAIVAADIEQTLKDFGYDVMGVVPSAEEAFTRVRDQKPDVVLMDIFLSGQLDGIAAAKTLRDSSGIPVVFLTAYADEAILQRAKMSGPYGYILKPFETTEIRAAIELALHRAQNENVAPPGPREQKKRRSLNSKTPHSDMQKRFSRLSSVYEILAQVKPFSDLPDQELRALSRSCNIASVPAMDVITAEGEDCAAVFVVSAGRLALLKSSASGRELIVELLGPGDVFDFSAVFDDGPFPLTIRAQCDSKVVWIPKAYPVNMLEKHPHFYRDLMRQMSQRVRAAHDISRALAHDTVELRIAAVLSQLVNRFATYHKEDDSYTLLMTRQEVADMTGTSPETAIRITKAMEREGLLDLKKPGVIKINDLESVAMLAENCGLYDD
jgi:CRP-like cAMP-binding protein/CheY-like chemotaxis protein